MPRPRGKLEMNLIENPKKRRATYKNRRDDLIQKAAAQRPLRRRGPLELAKQQRKLLKIEQCGSDPLSLQDCRLADLGALLATLDETLHKAQRRIAALGVPPPATAPTPHGAMPMAPLAGYRLSLDLAFGMPDAGAMVPQYYYFPPPHDMLPLLPQPPCLLSYHQMPPPMPMAPLDLCMTGTGATTCRLSPRASPMGPPPRPGFMLISCLVLMPLEVECTSTTTLVSGGQGFAAGHAGAGYEQEHHMSAAAWIVSRSLNNDPGSMDAAAAFQERNDLAELPAVSSCSSNGTSFHGGFQKK
ncbi:unnamed protein product [Urochloa humidicola]